MLFRSMRIRLTDTAAGANITPCGVSSYGEVEDYTLNVAAAGTMLDEDPTRLSNENERREANGVSWETENLQVYPNPNNGAFTIKSIHPGTYYLMSESGQLVQSFSLNAENQYTHNINGLSSGFYVLSGQNQFGISKQKIVV